MLAATPWFPFGQFTPQRPQQGVMLISAISCLAAAAWLGEVSWLVVLLPMAMVLAWLSRGPWLWAGLIAALPLALAGLRPYLATWLPGPSAAWLAALTLVVGCGAIASVLGLVLQSRQQRHDRHQQQPMQRQRQRIEHQRTLLQDQLNRYPVLFESCLGLSTVSDNQELAELISETCHAILPDHCTVWLFLSSGGALHCLAAQGPTRQQPDPEAIRYVATEQRLMVNHLQQEVFAAIPLRGDRRQHNHGNSHHRRGVLAVHFASQGVDNHLILELLTALGRLGGIGLASVDLLADAQQVALRDDLTQLFGRHEMMRRLNESVSKSQRDDKRLAVMLADLDHLKQINDQHGHHVGDQAIAAVADCLRKVMPKDATLCRYGGEEFAVVLPNAGLGTMGSLTEELLLQIRQCVFTSDHPDLRLTASAGYATWQEGENGWDVLQRADKACYQAKSNGRDQAVIAEHAPHDQAAS